MEYSIGQVSKLLDISIEGIRNYEKSGIIHSARTEESNYRKYRYLDIAALVRAKMYRSLGYSIKETAALINDLPLEDIQKAMIRRKTELNREILLSEQKLIWLEELERSVSDAPKELGRVTIRFSPPVFRLEYAHNGAINFSEEITSTFRQWMKYMPFIYISSRYRNDDVFGGLAIDEKYASMFQISENEIVRYHPSTLSLRLTVEEGDTGYSRVNILKALRDYAERHSFQISEDMIGHALIGIHKSRTYKRYRRIYAALTEELFF